MTRRATRVKGTGAVAAALLFLGLAAGGAAAQPKGGSDIYLEKCAVCHGADGAAKNARGRKLKVKDVRETVDKVTAAQMAEIVAKGKPPDMDGYAKELTADQIKEVVEHYRGLAKK
jgi:mono/diheme cytochrome c family protein